MSVETASPSHVSGDAVSLACQLSIPKLFEMKLRIISQAIYHPSIENSEQLIEALDAIRREGVISHRQRDRLLISITAYGKEATLKRMESGTLDRPLNIYAKSSRKKPNEGKTSKQTYDQRPQGNPQSNAYKGKKPHGKVVANIVVGAHWATEATISVSLLFELAVWVGLQILVYLPNFTCFPAHACTWLQVDLCVSTLANDLFRIVSPVVSCFCCLETITCETTGCSSSTPAKNYRSAITVQDGRYVIGCLV